MRILCFYIFIDIGSDCRDSGKVFVGILNHRESTVFLSINVFLIDCVIGQFDTIALSFRKRNLVIEILVHVFRTKITEGIGPCRGIKRRSIAWYIYVVGSITIICDLASDRTIEGL